MHHTKNLPAMTTRVHRTGPRDVRRTYEYLVTIRSSAGIIVTQYGQMSANAQEAMERAVRTMDKRPVDVVVTVRWNEPGEPVDGVFEKHQPVQATHTNTYPEGA